MEAVWTISSKSYSLFDVSAVVYDAFVIYIFLCVPDVNIYNTLIVLCNLRLKQFRLALWFDAGAKYKHTKLLIRLGEIYEHVPR